MPHHRYQYCECLEKDTDVSSKAIAKYIVCKEYENIRSLIRSGQCN